MQRVRRSPTRLRFCNNPNPKKDAEQGLLCVFFAENAPFPLQAARGVLHCSLKKPAAKTRGSFIAHQLESSNQQFRQQFHFLGEICHGPKTNHSERLPPDRLQQLLRWHDHLLHPSGKSRLPPCVGNEPRRMRKLSGAGAFRRSGAVFRQPSGGSGRNGRSDHAALQDAPPGADYLPRLLARHDGAGAGKGIAARSFQRLVPAGRCGRAAVCGRKL